MTKKEFFEKELDKRLAAIREEMLQKFEKEQEEQEDVFPKDGDTYWFIVEGQMRVASTVWDDYRTDKYRLATGNVFRTKEDAEYALEKQRVVAELEKYAEKDRKWDGVNQHFYFYCDIESDTIYTAVARVTKLATLYFESEEKAMEAVEVVGEDRVRRFYLEVED